MTCTCLCPLIPIPKHIHPQGVLDRLRGARELTLKRLYKLALRKALGNFLAGQLGVDVRWWWLGVCVTPLQYSFIL